MRYLALHAKDEDTDLEQRVHGDIVADKEEGLQKIKQTINRPIRSPLTQLSILVRTVITKQQKNSHATVTT